MSRALALLLAGALLAAPGSGATPSAPPAPDRLQELATRVVELQKKAVVAELEIERLRQRVAALEIELERERDTTEPTPGAALAPPRTAPSATPTPSLSAPASIPAEIEESELEPTPPPAVVSVPAPAGSAAPQPAPALTPPSGIAPATSEAAPPAASTSPARPVSGAAQALYDRGYTLYHQGQYAEAEAVFLRFLDAQADTELADNAWYWIGASRMARQDLHGALAAFETLVERYPAGNKVPDALLKMGRCLEQLGDPQAARAAFDELRRRFPDSPAAAALAPSPTPSP